MVVYRYIYTKEDNVIGFGRRYLGPNYGRLSAQSGYYVTGDLTRT
jgi:hypothetical protein